jgi:hypothetical protein
MLNQHAIGESVAYLVKHESQLREVMVKLGPRRIGDSAYLYACLLGFSFFFIGLFVLLQQPRLQASQVLFILCCLFLLVLVCAAAGVVFVGRHLRAHHRHRRAGASCRRASCTSS